MQHLCRTISGKISDRRAAASMRQVFGAAVALSIGAIARGGPASGSLSAAPAPHAVPPCAAAPCLATSSLPSGGHVQSGTASITQSGDTITVRQASQDVSISWQSFNIGPQDTVDFLQPSASALAINRIGSNNGSQILGHLDANGQVWLINPNGVLFGRGAEVNVGGLVASTLSVNDPGFGSATFNFSGAGAGSIVNQGSINAAAGGYVALIGKSVSNQGTISARLGTVALGAGSATTLTFAGSDLVKMQVDQSTVNALAANGGLIEADGGTVIMSAGAKDALLASVVNNTGVIEARTVANHDGTIELLGGMTAGSVTVGGTLDASAPEGGNGGFIETDAAQVHVTDAAKVTTLAAAGKAGTWLIDPPDFTIAPSGGDETGAALSSALTGANVIIQSGNGTSGSSGNINVDDTVSWSANTLTLHAFNDININSALNGSGSASLALQYGQGASNGVINGVTAAYNVNAPVNLPAGQNLSTQLGSSGPVVNYTVITSLGAAADASTAPATMTLQGIAATSSLSGHYALGSNIDATATAGWNSGAGFTPIGSGATYFTGSVDGLGHTISNLTINLPNANYVGLFGFTGGSAVIQNVGILSASVSGSRAVGVLAGGSEGTVNNSYATGSVSGLVEVGGLVGGNAGTVSNSYATGSVSGASGSLYVGGLVGYNLGAVRNSYATGSVSGTDGLGGLVGDNENSVTDSYATGSVNGSNTVGGLVGGNNGPISNSYATGSVSGSLNVGGLVGGNLATVTNSFWDTQTSTQSSSAGGTGLTTAQMQNTSNFVGFNFTSTPGAAGNNWVIVDSDGSLNNAGGAAGATFPMLASEYSTTINNAHQLQLMAMNLGASYTLGQNIDASATAGTTTDVWYGSTFIPIGNSGSNFTGSFNGQGYTINNLTINLPNAYSVGLFGYTDGAVIQNVGLVSGSVSGSTYVGALVAFNGAGSVSNSYATGSVSGTYAVGGLVGFNDAGSVSSSYATGSVSGASAVGGLVGYNSISGDVNATISNSYATGRVSGSNDVGGLVGENDCSVSNSYATGSVSGTLLVGGLVGYNPGTVSNSYATGSVTVSSGSLNVGGLVGENDGSVSNSYATGSVSDTGIAVGGLVGYNAGGTVSNSYATGNVSASNGVGGLVGVNGGTVSNSYATGSVSGTGVSVGGLAGYNAGGSITSSFWDTTTSGQSSSAGGSPLTDSQMQSVASFTGWSISAFGGSGDVWRIYQGNSYPLLTSFLTPLTLSAADATVTYNGSAQSGASIGAPISGVFGSAATGTNAGLYNGYYSNQQGYDLTGGNLTINPAALTLSGTRVYDGTTVVVGSVLTATGVAGQTFAVTGAGDASNLSSKDVQTGSTLSSVVGLGLGTSSNGGLASNYNALSTTGSSFSITPLALTGASIGSASSVYGSTVTPGVVTLNGVLAADAGSLSATARIVSPLYSASNNLRAGSYTQTATLSGADALDYTFAGGASSYTSPTANYTVSPLALTAASIASVNSIYGTPKPAGVVTLSGVLTGDTVSATASVVTPPNSTSGSGNLDAGSYAQTASALTGADAGDYTFTGYTTPTANYTVTPLALSASIAAVSSIYGTPKPTGAVTLTGVIAGDKVSSTASIVKPVDSSSGKLHAGSYAQTASVLTGADARNYSFAGGASTFTTPTANYTVGRLTLDVTGVTATNKVYNGSSADPLGGKAAIAPLKGDKVTLSGTGEGAFANANVGTGEAVTVSGYCLTGADAGNYALWEPSGLSANITQLSSVAWVGGSSGLWSKASNWAGGAIPDYGNVASVSIPSGATVTYDSGVPGATTLSTLTSSGTLVLTAGKLSTSGNLSTAGFEQSGGTLDVGGSLTIRSTSGGVSLGDISAGSLNVTSRAGAITQLVSTAIDVTGASSLAADNGVSGKGAVDYAVTLAQSADKLEGAVSAQGSAITLDDATALTATLDSTGAAALDSAGALVVAGTVGTSLTTVTTGGTHSTTTFDATSVGSSLKVTSTGAVTTATTSTVLAVDGEGTKTPNSHVTVDGVVGAEIK